MGEHKGKEREGTSFIWFQVFMPVFYEIELLTTKNCETMYVLPFSLIICIIVNLKWKKNRIIPKTQTPA